MCFENIDEEKWTQTNNNNLFLCCAWGIMQLLNCQRFPKYLRIDLNKNIFFFESYGFFGSVASKLFLLK